MNTHTIKIEQGYILVDLDATIQEGLYILYNNQIYQTVYSNTVPQGEILLSGFGYVMKSDCKKIIASSFLEGIPTFETLPPNNNRKLALNWWDNLYGKEARDLFKKYHPTVLSVSKATDEEIEHIYLSELSLNTEDDVEKLAQEFADKNYPRQSCGNDFNLAVRIGYKQAKSETKFSLRDIENAFDAGKKCASYNSHSYMPLPIDKEAYIQSLKQPEWEFEVEMEEVFTNFIIGKTIKQPKIINGKIQGVWKRI